MRIRKNSTLPLLASTALLSTGILASASSTTTDAPASITTATTTYTTPTPPPISKRAVVNAPPDAQPAQPTQMSPVMTVEVNGKPVLYTQKFSAVPDQWPKPSSGSIGLGTLSGEGTKTAEKRSEPTDFSSLKMRCRTVECRNNIEKSERQRE